MVLVSSLSRLVSCAILYVMWKALLGRIAMGRVASVDDGILF